MTCDRCARPHTYCRDDGLDLVRCAAYDWRKGHVPETPERCRLWKRAERREET